MNMVCGRLDDSAGLRLLEACLRKWGPTGTVFPCRAELHPEDHFCLAATAVTGKRNEEICRLLHKTARPARRAADRESTKDAGAFGLLSAVLLYAMIPAVIVGLLLLSAHPSSAIGIHQPGVERSTTRPLHIQKIGACGVLRRADVTYVLEKDVSSAGTCFSIQADNVTLDLNGHTVTYGASVKKHPVFGVLSADCWFKPIVGNPCGGDHRHIEIMNGKIVQGAGVAPFSHAVRMGQGTDFTGVKIHGLDITIAAENSMGIYTEYLPGGSDIYNNTIHNNVKVVSDRMQFWGTSIKLDNEGKARIPDLIHNNVVIGGPELGIRDDNPAGTRIYDNDISQNATYANGFCIDAAGDNMLVYHNHCHPIHGRGLHADHSGVQIFDNVVETVDSNQIQEYHGCEIHGTYGIQVESDNFNPTNVRVYGNHVIVHAAQCGADAMRLTDLKGADIQIYNNTFIAVQDKINGAYSTRGAYGLSVGNVVGTHLRFYNNVVRADTAIFYMDWDSGGDITLANNTFEAGRQGSSTQLAYFGTGVAPSYGNFFLDDTYQGFSPDSARFGPYTGDSWYGVLQTLHIRVTGKNGDTPKGLSATALDAVDAAPHKHSDEGAGEIRFILPVLRIENKKPPVSYLPYRITLQAPGCSNDTFEVPTPTSDTLSRQMACH